MQIYSCKVLLGGSRDNEVRKSDVTAAEIMILRALHGGDDFVTEIVPVSKETRSHAQERKRLWAIYVGEDEEGSSLGGFAQERGRLLQSLFGPSTAPLPDKLTAGNGFVDPDEPLVQRVKVPKGKTAEDIAESLA
jgi:hypothetical protein